MPGFSGDSAVPSKARMAVQQGFSSFSSGIRGFSRPSGSDVGREQPSGPARRSSRAPSCGPGETAFRGADGAGQPPAAACAPGGRAREDAVLPVRGDTGPKPQETREMQAFPSRSPVSGPPAGRATDGPARRHPSSRGTRDGSRRSLRTRPVLVQSPGVAGFRGYAGGAPRGAPIRRERRNRGERPEKRARTRGSRPLASRFPAPAWASAQPESRSRGPAFHGPPRLLGVPPRSSNAARTRAFPRGLPSSCTWTPRGAAPIVPAA